MRKSDPRRHFFAPHWTMALSRARSFATALTAAVLLLAAISSTARAACPPVPGDIDGNGKSNVVDVQCGLITVLWDLSGQPGSPPACLKGGNPSTVLDVNCSGSIDVVDINVIIVLALGGALSTAIDADGDKCVDNCVQPTDTTAPALAITNPTAGTIIGGETSINVSGTVSDESDVSVTVNGKAATLMPDGTWQAVAVSLTEGDNIITATAIDAFDNTTTATVLIRRDTMPPLITIETPPDGAVLGGVQADVAGLVNDIVEGTTIQGDDVTVMVNGVQAMVNNRAWVVPGLLLQAGENTVDATATDAAGNSRTATIKVTVDEEAGQRIVMVSGNAQMGTRGQEVEDPLVVALVDAQGDPIVGREVVFEVIRGDGLLLTSTVPPTQATLVRVVADDDGLASARFVLGQRAGAGNHRVRVTAPGFVGFVEFCFAVTPTQAFRVSVDSGENQTGVVGEPLPVPLRVLVTDAAGNAVENAPATFFVKEGGGHIDGETAVTVMTNSDGTASAILTLGPEPGERNNSVEVTIPFLFENAAVFLASGAEAGPAGLTSISGVVLTNEDEPMPLVFMQVKGTTHQAFTNAQGQFTITNAPVGRVVLVAAGTTTTLPGKWPVVEYEMHTVAGQENTLGMPVYLPRIDEINSKLVGGGEDVTLTMDGVPGATLTVFANSVTCLDGSSSCQVYFSQVNLERVPMPAPLGSSFMLAWSVQPAGTLFDPPARVCIPNSDYPPGLQVEVHNFDHDIEDWVVVGTATVTADGRQMCSDPGFGIVKAGWGGCVPPPPPKKCPSNCDDGNPCTSDSCKDGACVHTPKSGSCTDDGNPCTEDKCQGTSCTHPPKPDNTKCDDGTSQECGEAHCKSGQCKFDNAAKEGQSCDDGKLCTEPDKCQKGTCTGEKIKYGDLTFTPFNYNVTKFMEIVNKGIDLSKPIAPCSFPKGPELSVNFSVGQKKECCEAEQKKEATEGFVKGGFKVGAKIECTVASFPPLPKVVSDYFGVNLNVFGGVSVSGSGQGGKNPCTGVQEFTLKGSAEGEVGLQLVGVIINPKILKVYGGAKTGLSGNVQCVNTTGSAYLKWNGVTILGGYTIAGFIDKNFTLDWIKGAPLGSPINFSCELPDF